MHVRSKPRRRHSAEFKAEVIAACTEPGVSVSAVARRFELNDNLVHQWRRGRGAVIGEANARQAAAVPPHTEFVALSLPAPPAAGAMAAAECAPCIRIKLERGTTTLNVSWPLTASADCAGWMRELLR